MMNYQQLRIFNSYCDPHSQGFNIVNEAEVVFLEFSYFLCAPTNVGNLISPLPILSWLPVAQIVKNQLKNRRPEFVPWVGKILWRKAWQSTPVFLPGESPWTEEPGRLQFTGLQSLT